MGIRVREEREWDFPAIFRLVESAFEGMEESDHREQFLVERLHRSGTYVPQLSLVAESEEGEVAGYVLLTEVDIVEGEEKGDGEKSESAKSVKSLGVAPLAVRPDYQGQGIGGMLLKEAHRIAAALGYGSAVLLGHKDYYPRFGYRRAAEFGIKFPFDVPEEFCMAMELLPEALADVHGTVRYPDTFFE